MNQKLRICNTLSFIFIYIFNLSGFESIITGQTFKQLNHFSFLKSRNSADRRMSCPSQSDVTMAYKATVFFIEKLAKKKVLRRISSLIDRKNGVGMKAYLVTVATHLSTLSHNFVSFFNAKIYFSDKNECTFGFLFNERQFLLQSPRSRCVPKLQQ